MLPFPGFDKADKGFSLKKNFENTDEFLEYIFPVLCSRFTCNYIRETLLSHLVGVLENPPYNDYKEKERLAEERKQMDEMQKKNDREEAARVLEERRDRAHRAKRMAAQHLKEKAPTNEKITFC